MTDVYSTKGDKVGDLQLPQVFSTPFRHDLIHRIYTIQTTHSFQPKGTHPTAGMDVSADSLDPPTGHGQSRVARINAGGAGGRGLNCVYAVYKIMAKRRAEYLGQLQISNFVPFGRIYVSHTTISNMLGFDIFAGALRI